MSEHPVRLPFARAAIAVLATSWLPAACATHRGELIAELIFSVDGVVRDSASKPLEAVEVTLELGRPVFEIITPVEKRVFVTDQAGHFAVFFISHHSAIPYRLTFAKPGYAPLSVTGTSPPHVEHTVTLELAVPPAGAEKPPAAQVLPNNELQRTRDGNAAASPLNSVFDGRKR